MHIDAFFEYLMNKPHTYYEQVPPLHAPFPEDGRDGVPLEEDLAIRALDPKFRRKRGRRKAETGQSSQCHPCPRPQPSAIFLFPSAPCRRWANLDAHSARVSATLKLSPDLLLPWPGACCSWNCCHSLARRI